MPRALLLLLLAFPLFIACDDKLKTQATSSENLLTLLDYMRIFITFISIFGPFIIIIFALVFIIVYLFKKIKDKMKSSKLMRHSVFLVIIFGMIVLLLQLLIHKEPEFTQFTDVLQDSYYENVLVKNAPKNSLEQYKMMIAYFDSAGLSTSKLSKKLGVKYYDMRFYESTDAARKYFTEKLEDRRSKSFDHIEPYVYLGRISMYRCMHDSTKWVIKISRKIGIDKDNYPINEFTVLSNECGNIGRAKENDKLLGYFIDGAKENGELVKYYIELRDKRK
jgi:hypothetical protein